MLNRRQQGFTLVETLVALIIAAVLVSIVATMMQAMKAKTVVTEAEVGLSAIRSSLRQYRVEYGRYPGVADGATRRVDTATAVWFPGLKTRSLSSTTYDGSLDAAYFSQDCYGFFLNPGFDFIAPVAGTGYIQCSIADGAATALPPKWSVTRRIGATPDQGTIYMDIATGEFYQGGVPASGLDSYGTPDTTTVY